MERLYEIQIWPWVRDSSNLLVSQNSRICGGWRGVRTHKVGRTPHLYIASFIEQSKRCCLVDSCNQLGQSINVKIETEKVEIKLNLPPKWPRTLTRGCGKCSRTSTPTCPRPTSTRRWSPFAQSESIGYFSRRNVQLNASTFFRYIKSPDLLHKLIDLGLTFRLLPLLSKSNLKVVDIAFSIMGNIMLEDLPKKQVRE